MPSVIPNKPKLHTDVVNRSSAIILFGMAYGTIATVRGYLAVERVSYMHVQEPPSGAPLGWASRTALPGCFGGVGQGARRAAPGVGSET